MIANIFKSDNLEWIAHQVREDHYYIEHSTLQNIVNTRIYCSRANSTMKKRIAWPIIKIRAGGKTFQCNSAYIERALEISHAELDKAYQGGKKTLQDLLNKRVVFLKTQLDTLLAYRNKYLCNMDPRDHNLMSPETFMRLIKEIEQRKAFWLAFIAENSDSCLSIGDLHLPIIVTQSGQIVIEFPKHVEKGTGKNVHEAFDYLHSKPLVCLRPIDEETWRRELRVQKIISSVVNPDYDISGLMISDTICPLFAIQKRCEGDLLNKITEFTNDRKLFVALRMAKAIAVMHQLGMVHGDIKMDNVLIDHNNVYLTDFGFTRLVTIKKVHECWGTRGMFAPEMRSDATCYKITNVEGAERDFRKFDSFSFGIVLWSMCYEDISPFDEDDRELSIREVDDLMNFKEGLLKPKKGTVGRVISGLTKKNANKRWFVEKAARVLEEIIASQDFGRGFGGCNYFSPMLVKKWKMRKNAVT